MEARSASPIVPGAAETGSPAPATRAATGTMSRETALVLLMLLFLVLLFLVGIASDAVATTVQEAVHAELAAGDGRSFAGVDRRARGRGAWR